MFIYLFIYLILYNVPVRRYFACCKYGGINPDKDGKGIKPFAVNEMSMLAYYHELHPDQMMLLPVVPAYKYLRNRWVINISDFGPYGRYCAVYIHIYIYMKCEKIYRLEA